MIHRYPQVAFVFFSLAIAGMACQSDRQKNVAVEDMAGQADSYKYVAPEAEEAATIVPEDLGVRADQLPSFGSKSLDLQASVGRFPTGLALVQVVAATEIELDRRHIRLADTSDACSAAWSELATNLPVLREVKVQTKVALDPRGTHYRDWLRKATQNGCHLCLIYSRVDPTEADAEFIAALWDATACRPLAVYRVPVTIPGCERMEPMGDETPKPKQLHWLEEADFRAESDLRQFVRNTLWELAQLDALDATTRPSPWQNDRPLYPRGPRVRLLDVDTLRGK